MHLFFAPIDFIFEDKSLDISCMEVVNFYLYKINTAFFKFFNRTNLI